MSHYVPLCQLQDFFLAYYADYRDPQNKECNDLI